MIQVTTNKGVFYYSKFEWRAAWWLMWLGGFLTGFVIFGL